MPSGAENRVRSMAGYLDPLYDERLWGHYGSNEELREVGIDPGRAEMVTVERKTMN